jgi:Tol biopolymer transport system component
MTTADDLDRMSPEFDRLMAAWFETEARVHEPGDLLDRTLSRTASTRPRPTWLLPERWLPMESTMRRVRVPRAMPYIALLALVLLLFVAALAIVGSQRRVPPPFGPAVNGFVAIATAGGDITMVDPLTGVTDTIVSGPERDRYPVFSRDGTRLAFVRSGSDGDALFAIDEDGANLVRLTHEPLPASGSTGLLVWSPEGRRLAFHSGGTLWIALTDGSGAHAIDLGVSISDEIHWRPPSGDEILVRGIRDGLAGLLLVKADGTGVRELSPFDGAENDYLWHTWSPDGSLVAFSSKDAHETHLLTVDGPDVVIHPEDGQGIGFPRFSPDGTRLALMVWGPGDVRVGVAPAGDTTPRLKLTGPVYQNGKQRE